MDESNSRMEEILAKDEIREVIMHLRYLDRFEKRADGQWLIANRLCVWDFEYMVPASYKWDLGETFIRGRIGRQDPSYRF